MPKEIEVYRPLKGQLYPIEQVQDPVFSKKDAWRWVRDSSRRPTNFEPD